MSHIYDSYYDTIDFMLTFSNYLDENTEIPRAHTQSLCDLFARHGFYDTFNFKTLAIIAVACAEYFEEGFHEGVEAEQELYKFFFSD